MKLNFYFTNFWKMWIKPNRVLRPLYLISVNFLWADISFKTWKREYGIQITIMNFEFSWVIENDA
jgi:hypothetical protein